MCVSSFLIHCWIVAEIIEKLSPAQQKTMVHEGAGDPSDFDVDDVLLGTKLASLAVTDDEQDTLKKVGKMNPWHIEALTLITGSEEEAHKPLTYILDKHMKGMKLDCNINKVGMTPGGHFLDTQGYIAHNDEIIVLAYRCTTSIFDWLTNFNVTSSEWELDEDIAQGYSGKCSGLEGLCCTGGKGHKPRVHTGFYNNFLATIPDIQTHIAPLLSPNQPPRKLFVCGHSLGAGIATLAGCYFLLEYDWSVLPQSLVTVTAGSPRACQNGMRDHVLKEMKRLEDKGCGHKVAICRVVNDKDIVATLPPAMLGYRHIDDLVFISENGGIRLIGEGNEGKSSTEDIKAALLATPSDFKQGESQDSNDRSAYQAKVKSIPKILRDHMPDFYLKPMMDVAASTSIKRTATEDEVEVGYKK
jgi:Lipase (class 3)